MPCSAVIVVPCHASGEVLEAINILTGTNANMADDVDLAHLSACVAGYHLGMKPLSSQKQIPEKFQKKVEP
jgi:hypothetical protein